MPDHVERRKMSEPRKPNIMNLGRPVPAAGAVTAEAEAEPAPAPVAQAPVEAPVAEAPAQPVAETASLFDEAPVAEAAPAATPVQPVSVARTGDPSPAALQRLRAAVNKEPGPREDEEEEPQVNAEDENQGRFAINNLINKMTGHSDKPMPRRQPLISHPPAQSYDDYEDDEQERVEIPAFLRRQAN